MVWAASAWEHALLPHLRLAGLPRLPVMPFSLLARRRKFSDPMTWKPHGFAHGFAPDTPLALTLRGLTAGPRSVRTVAPSR